MASCCPEVRATTQRNKKSSTWIPSGVTHFFVANAFDAMLSDWPYRNGLPMLHGLEKIRSGAGTQFEPKIVEAFLAIPWSRWIGLRESLDSPLRLTHSRNMGFVQWHPPNPPEQK